MLHSVDTAVASKLSSAMTGATAVSCKEHRQATLMAQKLNPLDTDWSVDTLTALNCNNLHM